MNLFPVSIARFSPKGTDFMQWADVAPAKDILFDYKNGKIDEKEYERRYRQQLSKTDIAAGLKRIKDIMPERYDGIVFLCYEKTGAFCHRHILADYLKEHFGIEVLEVTL